MSLAELVPILRDLRDQGAAPDAVARARALLAAAEELPAELREAVTFDDPVSEAIGLLALLAPDAALPIADAVRDEAGQVDVTEAVAAFADGWWLSAFLDHELDETSHRVATRTLMETGASAQLTAFADIGHAVREGVPHEAGEADLWGAIAPRIGLADPEEVSGWDGALLAEAVRHEAGTVDVADTVISRIRRQAVALEPSASPPPANSPMGWWMPALAGIAAALLFGVLYDRLPGVGGAEVVVAWDLQFAAADEIAIDDLDYGAETMVQVFQGDGANAPLIIWIEEETEARL